MNLAIPSARTLAKALCPDDTFNDSLGAVTGHARETGTGRPLECAVVTAEWTDWLIGRGGVRERDRHVEANQHRGGPFVLRGRDRGG